MRGAQQPWRALCVISLRVVQWTSGNIISQRSKKYLATITCNLHACPSAPASIHSRLLRMSQRRIHPAHEQTSERQRASGRCRHLKQCGAECDGERTPTMAHKVSRRCQRPFRRVARRCTAVYSLGRTCGWPSSSNGRSLKLVQYAQRYPYRLEARSVPSHIRA